MAATKFRRDADVMRDMGPAAPLELDALVVPGDAVMPEAGSTPEHYKAIQQRKGMTESVRNGVDALAMPAAAARSRVADGGARNLRRIGLPAAARQAWTQAHAPRAAAIDGDPAFLHAAAGHHHGFLMAGFAGSLAVGGNRTRPTRSV